MRSKISKAEFRGTREKMSSSSGKKREHPIINNVISGIVLLFCTTIYNLFLAHIWPVAIHFGEYSLNNFIFILASILSSLLLVVIILALEMYYISNTIGRVLFNAVMPQEKREKRNHQWYEYILDAFLLAATGVFAAIVWLYTFKTRRDIDKATPTEETQKALENFIEVEQKIKQK